MEKLKLGFIGCGGIANQKHFPALAKLTERAEMVALCDDRPERAAKAQADFGAPGAQCYASYPELLAKAPVDAVYVLTPNVSHSEISIAAMRAGKHVMCEKPMAINTAQAEAMLNTAIQTGKKLNIAYQNRFRHDVIALRKACLAGELGEIYLAKAHAIRRRAVPTWGVFADKAKQGGGPLIDIGTHALDLALWLMDNHEPAMVVGQTFQKLKDKPEGNIFGPWDPATFEVEDSAFGFIRMKSGAVVQLDASWALNILNPKEASVTLCGTEGGVEMAGQQSQDLGYLIYNRVRHGQMLEEQPSGGGGVAYFGGATLKAADREASAWLDSLAHDAPLVVKPEQALVVTRILEAVYASAASGEAVYF